MANDILAPLLRPETGRRLLFTAGVLLAYRVGCQIPLPGVNTEVFAGLHGLLKAESVSIFALSVTPFFSVLFVFELIKLIIWPLSRWEASDPKRARRLSLVVYLVALAVAGFQARGLAQAYSGVAGLIDGPEWENLIAITLVAGTALLFWLGEKITAHGLGNGFWLLLITPTLAMIASTTAGSFELMRQGAIQQNALAGALAFLVVATALITMISKRASASTENRVSGAGFAGVWPPLFAASISDVAVAYYALQAGGLGHLLLLAVLIAAFNGLQWLGSAAAAARPVWAIALVQMFVCAGGELLTHSQTLPFPINGPWLIVIVTTAISCLRSIGLPANDLRSEEPAA